ncbi:SLBB domain-containing protein, partial [Candidatus Saganbacteria bacterium]|nr:SLBB domain-containing protein [Candidatus Saganbacteria bacterium]
QQKQKLQNLTPEEKSKIKEIVDPTVSPPTAPTQPSSPSSASAAKPTEGQSSVSPVDNSPAEQPKEAFSSIEKGFISKIKDEMRPTQQVLGTLRQFGYDVFQRTVGQKFALISSLPIGPNYRINPGDNLLVTIWGSVNDSFAMIVDDRGSVVIPKVGVVTIAGLTLAEAKELLMQRLAIVFVTDFNVDLTLKEIGAIKIYLTGEINKPGAYTTLANTTLYDAVFLGGGPTRAGTLRNIELVRNGQKIKTVDLYKFILSGSKAGDLLLQSGDVIRVPLIGKVVAISGNVNRPAIYELKGTTELSDFVELAGGITPTSYLQRIQIERRGKNIEQRAQDVNYADYLKVKNVNPVYLENLDSIAIFSIDATIRKVVYLEGSVTRSGRYELTSEMRLEDLLNKAQGLSSDAYLGRAQIFRLAPPDMHPEVLAIDLNKTKQGDLGNNPLLKEFDRVRVFSKKGIEGESKVYIAGEVNDGDKTYPLTANMRVSDLVFQAGGVKKSAYLEKAELYRAISYAKIDLYNIDLRLVLENKDKTEDLLLEKDDYLIIRRLPDYRVNSTVTLQGNFLYPGKYVLFPNERLSSVVTRAGGFTGKAFLEGAVFTRESLKQQLTSEATQLQRDLQTREERELLSIPMGLSSEENLYRTEQIKRYYDFNLNKINWEIPGRILLDLNKIRPGNEWDIVLQNGDTLTIPDQINSVTVIGDVYSSGASLLYEQGKSANYYINLCGGGNKYADLNNVTVLRANGRTEKDRWLLTIAPGDTILVPTKPGEVARYEKPFDWNQFWQTTGAAMTAITQLTTSVVTVYLLYKAAAK